MDKLQQLMTDVERDLDGLMPIVSERIKRRVHLAYLWGIEDAREDHKQIDTPTVNGQLDLFRPMI